MDQAVLDKLKEITREDDIPFYTDEQYEFYYEDNNRDVNRTLYVLLVRKSENTSLNVSGVRMSDESAYFKRLAQQYRPNNSGTLK